MIRLANFTDREINLQESEIVGQFYPLNHTQAMVHSLDCEEPDGEAPQQEIGDLPTKRTSSRSSECLKELNIEKSELTRDQELRFLATVREYEDVFAKNESDLGLSHLMEHEIDTGDHKPIKQHPRRLPPHQRQLVEKQMESLLSQGRITPSNSPWSSPVVWARKRDGSFRMCIDYCKLNAVTSRDVQPLPRVDDILKSLDGACYFSCLDLASGYWQVKVAAKDRAKTAFVTPQGQFEWVSNAIWSYQCARNLPTTDEHGSARPNVEILPRIHG